MNSLATLDQAKRYLERVLPWPPEQQGKPTAFANVHYTFVPENHDPNKPLPWSGRACRTLEEAVRAVKWAAGASNVRDIYLCLSTQREPSKERTDADLHQAHHLAFCARLRRTYQSTVTGRVIPKGCQCN
jgi:hypothetical protein